MFHSRFQSLFFFLQPLALLQSLEHGSGREQLRQDDGRFLAGHPNAGERYRGTIVGRQLGGDPGILVGPVGAEG